MAEIQDNIEPYDPLSDSELQERKFEVAWCETCKGLFVRCPRCGNNSCNGTYGEDKKCPVCPLAYAMMNALEQDGIRDIAYSLLNAENKESQHA